MNDASARRLADGGWVKRFTACGPRLEEMIHAYQEIGFEVRLEPVDLETVSGDACRQCFLVQSGLLFTVFTRPDPAKREPSTPTSFD